MAGLVESDNCDILPSPHKKQEQETQHDISNVAKHVIKSTAKETAIYDKHGYTLTPFKLNAIPKPLFLLNKTNTHNKYVSP